MARTRILHLAAGTVGWVGEFRQEQIGDLAHGFAPVKSQSLLIGIGNVSCQIRQHDTPGLRVLPNQGIEESIQT